MPETVVKIENLSKIYKLYRSPSDRLKETFHLFRKTYHEEFYALRDISFDIEKGKTIGIIGQNGAGKSTLLKILTGVLTPSAGRYTVKGTVSSLLELGAGFNPDLTGLENVYFNGAVLGFTQDEMDKKIDKILDFADIGKFIHQKVKMYSSGMFVRLAFSVAVQVDPDLLIVDEALSVGDIRFQQKCYRRMRDFKNSGKTVLFVTHDQGTVTNFCDYVYWLKDGCVFEQGHPKEVVKKYISYMSYGLETKTSKTPEQVKPDKPNLFQESVKDQEDRVIRWVDISQCASFGEGGAKIVNIAMVHQDTHEKVELLKGGEPVVFIFRLKIMESLESPGIGISVADQLGNIIFSITSFVCDYQMPELKQGDNLICRIGFEFPHIRNGKYSVSVAVAEGSLLNHNPRHWVHDVCVVEVANDDLKYSLGYVVVKDSRIDVGFLSKDNDREII